MPKIDVQETLNSSVEQVWKLICDLEAYPKLMEPVRAVKVLSSKGHESIVEWEVELKGSILRWTETEERKPEEYRITYEQLQGDLEMLRGYWLLRPLENGRTEALLQIEFEIGIPMLRDMLNPIAVRALSDNARVMLRSLNVAVKE
ncbi:ribosome-associated toxin RatA of RatAB toxin-antitoxin module [Bradyrhizobium sp. AZCC 1678]|uniref:type II toxin-antitoxin system RatA family toxin n=1 Tax=Bradyrhizobium sp. AZCC 1678 TaxID=3117030 RepID=UPI002FF15AD6